MTTTTFMKSGAGKNQYSYLYIVISFFLICLFFPTCNSSIDAYAFGYSVKWGVELFYSHHILYSPFILVIYKIFINAGLEVDALDIAKYINAFFASVTLIVLYKILFYFNGNVAKSLALILFVAGSFSMLRFSTENETYILPVFFSVVGTYFLVRDHLSPNKFYLFSGALILAIACLFHTIHFFWWLAALTGMFFFAKGIKNKILVFIIFFLTGCVVPAVYSFILAYGLNIKLSVSTFFEYILYDFKSGNVQTEFSLNNIKLSVINLIRTFFQFHGNIVYLFSKYPVYYFIVPIITALIYNSLFPFLQFKFNKTHPKINFIVFSALFLHILCAVFSVGNIEFMVMIPGLTCLILNSFNVPVAKIVYLSVAMLLWNLAIAIIPDSRINYYNTNSQLQYVQENPEKVLIFSQAVLLNNMYHYNSGKPAENLYFLDPQNSLKIDSLIKSGLAANKQVVTDVTGNPEPMNRNSILHEKFNENFFKTYHLLPVDSLNTFYGMRKIYQIIHSVNK